MKKKWCLIVSLTQILVGVLGVAAFAIMAAGGEDMQRWIITLVLALGYVAMGIMGIIEWRK
jgi:hypothetical protein